MGSQKQPNPSKKRLDELLVSRGLAPTRSKAQALIMAGQILINGQVVIKAASRYLPDTLLNVLPGRTLKYASRGGLKLEGAIETLKLSLAGKIAMDVGSSTGGFTDCLLQYGALMVYAIDVGHGLIDARLRNDPRVRLMEKTNARQLNPEHFISKPQFATIDVSFISLTKILPSVAACLGAPYEILAMVKPQFEAGKGQVKRGVVKDEAIREAAIDQIRKFATESMGLKLTGECPSPLPGPEGNLEHFLHFKNP